MVILFIGISLKHWMIMLLLTWVVVKLNKVKRAETIWQGKSERSARTAMHNHIKEAGEKPIKAWREDDEFGKGESIITKNKYDDETFYTTGDI